MVALKEKITRITFDIIVLGFLKDVRPLKGILANIDWIYSGAISRMIIEEKISGSGGEALLMATGDKMKTPRVLLLGLGETANFSYNTILRFSSEIADRLRELKLVGGAFEIPDLPADEVIQEIEKENKKKRTRKKVSDDDADPAAPKDKL